MKTRSCENCPAKIFSIFSDLNSEEIMSLEKNKVIHQRQKNQNLFTYDTSLSGIYCIRSGHIKLNKVDNVGNEIILKIASPGEILADEILFDKKKTNKAAIALTKTEVCFIDKSYFLEMIKTKSSIVNKMAKHLCENIEKIEDELISFHHKKSVQRLAELLIYLKNINGTQSNNRWKINLKLTRKEMAILIGTASETLIRSMMLLKKKGIIEEYEKFIYINNENALLKIARPN